MAGLIASETAAPVAAARRRWALLALMISCSVLVYADRQMIAILKPLMQQDMGWSDSDYGRLASLFQFSTAISLLGTGWIVDRLGAKWATPAGLAAWCMAAMGQGLATTMGQFSATRMVVAAAEAMGTPSFVKTVGALFSTGLRPMAFGLANAAGNFGAIITPLLLPALAVAVGWRGAFIFIGALGLLFAVSWLLLTRSVVFPGTPTAAVERPQAGGLRALLRDRRTWGLVGSKALSDQVFWLLIFWTPDFFHRVFGLSVAGMGPPLAAVYSAAAVGALGSAWITSRLLAKGLSINTVRKGMMLACALLVTPIPLAAHTHDLWVAVALLGLTLAAHQGFSVNVFSAIADIIPKARVGAVTGFCAFCGNLAGVGIVFAAGEVLSAGQGYAPLLIVAAGSYLAAVVWLQLWLPRLTLADEAT